jgi:branched-chain amino acid transport system substrate-binding protein
LSFLKKNHIVSLCLLLCLFPVLGPSATGEAPTSAKLSFGVLEPLTGPSAGGGALEAEGIEIANQLYPTVKVGDTVYEIELVMADNKSSPIESANAARRLADEEGVRVVLGSWSSRLSLAAGPILMNRQVPAIGLSCTNPLVTKDNEYYFRICFVDPYQGTVMADYAYREAKAKTAVILRDMSNDYSVGLARSFAETFTALAGEGSILSVLDYATGAEDFSALLGAVKARAPDVVYLPGYASDSAAIIRQARALGIETPFLGGDIWETPEFIDAGREAVEGAAFSTFYAPELSSAEAGAAFLKEFRERHGTDPSAVAALGFDGYLVARAAVERAGCLDTIKIRDAIGETKDFPGATGMISIDRERNAVKSAVIKSVKDGEFSYLTTIQP